MASDKQMRHILGLAKRRKLTPASLKQSEAAITDTMRVKQEAEAVRAAKMWERGMNRETRK